MSTQTAASEDGRPVDTLLAQHAAGTLSGPMSVLLSAHLDLSPENRAYLDALDTLGGIWLEDEALAPVGDREHRLAAIFDSEAPAPARRQAGPIAAGDDIFPAALRRFVGEDFDRLAWKSRMPGLRECHLSSGPEGEASLLWIRAGQAMPSHTHTGTEATLVLRGSFTDANGTYRRGDIAIADDSIDHKPVTGTEEDCICFVVNDGGLTLTGPIGRWFSRFVR